MGQDPAARAVVPKEHFCRLQPTGQGSSPKRTFSWCWLVCLCHVIKTTKMADKLEKALTFQTETNILHHYEGILLLKLLSQNQNYQLVLCGSRDWSLWIWLTALDGFAISGIDPDPSRSIWPTPTQTSLLIHTPNVTTRPNVLKACQSHQMYIPWTLFCGFPYFPGHQDIVRTYSLKFCG